MKMPYWHFASFRCLDLHAFPELGWQALRSCGAKFRKAWVRRQRLEGQSRLETMSLSVGFITSLATNWLCDHGQVPSTPSHPVFFSLREACNT